MTALTAKAGSPGSLKNDSFDGQSCLVGGFWRVRRAVLDPLKMTALTAKAAWWVLEGSKGSPGSLRNDSFDGQSGQSGICKNDSFDGQSCLVGFGGFEGQSWIP